MSKGKAYKPENDPGWWRDVCGYGGKYQVSRHGDVRRVYSSGLVHAMSAYTKSGKQFRARLFVKLTKDGKSKEEPLLQIVAAAWLGLTPAGMVPYHLNGNVTDNRADNIGFTDRQTHRRNGGRAGDRVHGRPGRQSRGDLPLGTRSSSRQLHELSGRARPVP